MESWEDVADVCMGAAALVTFFSIWYNYAIFMWHATAALVGRQLPSMWTKPFFVGPAIVLSCVAAMRVYYGEFMMIWVVVYGATNYMVINPLYNRGSMFRDIKPDGVILLVLGVIVQTVVFVVMIV